MSNFSLWPLKGIQAAQTKSYLYIHKPWEQFLLCADMHTYHCLWKKIRLILRTCYWGWRLCTITLTLSRQTTVELMKILFQNQHLSDKYLKKKRSINRYSDEAQQRHHKNIPRQDPLISLIKSQILKCQRNKYNSQIKPWKVIAVECSLLITLVSQWVTSNILSPFQ